MTDPDAETIWLEVDRYIEDLFVPPDPTLGKAIVESTEAGLPAIHVSPTEGRLLYMLALMTGTKRILEIGLLGGYSTIWLARALPEDGRLVSLEIDPHHAEVARKNLERAGVSPRVEICVGPALASLDAMVRAREAPFDLVFIDADKEAYPAYLDWSLKLVHSGSVILADNVVRNGGVVRPAEGDPVLTAIREFNRRLGTHPGLEGFIVPLMRNHLDGLAIARVK